MDAPATPPSHLLKKPEGVPTAVRVLRTKDGERREEASGRRQEFETTLHEALEISKQESDAYGVMAEALCDAVPRLQVEMLVADSSRAHFGQTLRVGDESQSRTGCGVVSPLDCSATTRGRTLVFPTSREMSACPYLRARASGEMSAACVAVSITGMTVGVVHATGADGVPPTVEEIRYLEVTSRRASERIAMLSLDPPMGSG
jgi:hypothetical protein